MIGVMQFGYGPVFGAIIGQALDGAVVPMSATMGVAGVLCLPPQPPAGRQLECSHGLHRRAGAGLP